MTTATVTNEVVVDILQKYKESQRIQFFVKTINGQRWSMQTPTNVRVHLVKALIEQNLKIFMEEQLLIVKGKQLNDFVYLYETNLKNGDTIKLMPSMRSGSHRIEVRIDQCNLFCLSKLGLNGSFLKRDPKALFDVLLEEIRPELSTAIQQFEKNGKISEEECLFLTYDADDRLKLTSFPCATDHRDSQQLLTQYTESVMVSNESRSESLPCGAEIQQQQSSTKAEDINVEGSETQNAITKAKLEKIHRDIAESKSKKITCRSPAEYEIAKSAVDSNVGRKIAHST